MRYSLFFFLFAFQVNAQALIEGSFSSDEPLTCTLDSAQPALVSNYRATSTTGTGYQCDALLASCVDLGPGARNFLGSNVAGDILLGPGSGSGTSVRVFGDVTVSNVITVGAALDFVSTAFLRNPFAAQPVTTNEFDGQRLVPQVYVTFPTCGASGGQLPFGTELEVTASATSAQRRCRCVATGGSSSSPRWLNTNTNNYGATQSDCPESTVPGPPVAPNPGNPPGGPP